MIVTNLICTTPTKTLTKDKIYVGVPVRKGQADSSYNGRWCTQWEECPLGKHTSFKVLDDVKITRYISKKRFYHE